MKARALKAVPSASPAPQRYAIGAAALENFDRSVYQSTHSTQGRAAPLPYTLEQALAESERERLA